MKETIMFNNRDKLFKEFQILQKLQFELDEAKRKHKEIQKTVRTLSQTIPDRLRALKL